MKKVISIIAGILIVIAPTLALAGLWLYLQTVEPTLIESEIINGVLKEEGKESTGYEQGDAFFELLLSMHGKDGKNTPIPTASLPEEALTYEQYTMVYTDSNDMQYSYTYYLSEDPDKCYFVDQNKRTYTVARSAAEAFLNSDYSEKVYSASAFPTLTVNGSALSPYTVDWNYKTIGGVLKKASCSYKDKDISGVLDGIAVAFDPIFSISPSEVSLTVTDKASGNKIYEGNIDGFKDLEIENFIEVSVDMTVVWKNSEDAACSGSANYFFDSKLFGTASFALNKAETTCGEVLVITASNVVDASKIEIEFAPAINYKPVFYSVGNNSWQALLPIAHDLVTEKTEYLVTMKMENESDIAILTVNPIADAKLYSLPSDKNSNTLMKDDALKSGLVDLLKTVALARSQNAFTGGKFVAPTDRMEKIKAKLGDTIRLNDASKPENCYRYVSLNNLYAASWDNPEEPGKASKVMAATDGKVVYVGSHALTGRIVAIDHGSGLITWYTNLSPDIAVSAGDQVKAGDFIAHVADGGVNSTNNCLFTIGATVNGVPVSLDFLVEEGIILTK